MKKNVLKALRGAAKNLPPVQYWGYPKHFELIRVPVGSSPKLTESQFGDGMQPMEDRRIIKSRAVKYPVNHYRRLKRAVQRDGAAGMHQYFAKIKRMATAAQPAS